MSYFYKRPSLLLAIIFILLVIVVSILAYPLAYDKSPNANRMIVELAAKPVGFSIDLLRIPKVVRSTEHHPIQKTFLGTPDQYQYIPIRKVLSVDSQVKFLHYIDDGLSDTLAFPVTAFGPQQLTIDTIIERYVVRGRFMLGTDRYGRDIYSRLIIGSRVSMAVGIVSVIMSISIGLLLGAAAGWYGGWVDNAVMYLVNILWAIPTILLVFAITISLGKGFWEIFIAIGITSWVGAARLIRGQVMQVKNLDYITAARALGYKDFRIIVKHILPNISGPIMVIAAANFAAAILTEAGLSFLGIGVQPPTPSWGLMIKEHYNFLIAGRPIIAIIPGIAIMLLVLSFNIIGNALRDYIDVRNDL